MKYKKFEEILKRNWNKVFESGCHVTLDEGVAPFLGRSEMKQYMKAKPEKWGLKVYLIADSATHYIVNSKLYTGSVEGATNYTIRLVLSLMTQLLWKGHRLFIDSFYTSPEIIKILYYKDTFVTGMVKANRKGLPTNLKGVTLNEGELKSFKNDYMHLDVYKDKKRQLNILTNVYSNYTTNDRPESVIKYNEHMNGVDKANQTFAYYRFEHKQRKWWKAYFIELLEISLANSFILYSSKVGVLSHKKFRLAIAKSLLDNVKLKDTYLVPVISQKQHYLDYSIDKNKRLCIECKSSRPIWICKNCSKKKKEPVHLCQYPCFEIYHSK